VGRAALVVERDRPVEGPAVQAFQAAVRRRAVGREPVAYITGVKGFRHLDLAVDSRVLIPRPETEHLVEAALALPAGARVADVGTGSGAVALALKDERPDLDVVGTDTSADALAVARANAARLRLDVAFLHGDLLAGAEDVDAVLSNPPYVEEGAALAPEITRHEPAAALYAGPDGLSVIRRLATAAGASPARLLALEVGAGQADAVADVVRAAGFAAVAVVPDLAGIERIVVGRR
jgi:release factor glutamine methyltransferase